MRVPAWRNIGQNVTEALTAEQAIQQGGLDFQVKVSEQPVSTNVDGVTITSPNRFMTYAQTSSGELHGIGVVGNRYTPIQNREAFQLLNNIVDDSGAIFDTAGKFDGYSKCYITLKLPQTITVAGGADALDTYLHCVNSHDGTSSFTIHTMFLRQICTNGLKGFRAGSSVSLRHTVNSSLKVQDARFALGLIFQEQEQFRTEVESLLSKPMSNSDFKKFVDELVPLPDDLGRAYTNAENVRGNLFSLWTADTQKNVAGTAWAAYNTVTEYVDWFSPVRGDNAQVRKARQSITGRSPMVDRAHELLATL